MGRSRPAAARLSSPAVREHRIVRRQLLEGAPEEVFPFFADARNLERITPPLLRFRVLTPAPIEVREGTLIDYRLRVHGVPVRWRTLIAAWDPPHRFVDVQLRGPYALWHHTHEFAPADGGRTLMTDTIRYAVGAGVLGRIAHALVVRRDVERIFAHREAVLRGLLAGAAAA